MCCILIFTSVPLWNKKCGSLWRSLFFEISLLQVQHQEKTLGCYKDTCVSRMPEYCAIFDLPFPNTICQAVAKSSIKLPRSSPISGSFPLKASNRDACRLPLLRTQVPAYHGICLVKKRQTGRCNEWRRLHNGTFLQMLTRQASQSWRASISQCMECLGLTRASRVRDFSSNVEKLSGKRILEWERHCLCYLMIWQCWH